MSLIDEELEKLKSYTASVHRPIDFKDFWQKALQEDFQLTAQLELERISYPLTQVEVFKASLCASDGVMLKGYYLRPASVNIYPALVRFHGYSGNRGQISELLFWALQGYAILGLDVRGQCGETPDGRIYPQGGFSGWMTLGIDSPNHHYFRYVYLDAVRAIVALSKQPEVDSERLGVFGKSQGGGLAVISAGLINGLGEEVGLQTKVKVISAAIPFLADFRGSFKMQRDGEGPIAELSWYFRLSDPEHKHEEDVFKVLDYFDTVNFAPWVGEAGKKGFVSKSLVSMGLKDTACPPPTVYALYQALSGEKKLLVYPEYGHESPDEFVDRQLEFLARELR
ncbi:acetylxylan esterase [Desulfitobacterium metallireducens]|uniref:Acetyl xylan esterase n=1 Tax=Desulfitobacterium metallireducens DSM 15288 TaxID=871968 RepID=W0E9D8_9FIRM|nr:acetylxylan esterase [Desulfitobacterium metallireducens]AHF05834.1 acetyl xylan esterase [Desulfitobacterium metallireducens DSM 15288]